MRKTKIIGVSVPPEVHAQFESVLKCRHKTKSEFFREILDIYFKNSPVPAGEKDIAHMLRKYWEFRSGSEAKVVVVGLGIIAKDGKVLIGQRKAKDPWVDNLTWVFPGGQMHTLHFNEELKKSIKKETGFDVEVKSLVASRIHPDSGFKSVQIVALYFWCETIKGKEAPGDSLAKLKWVKPADVFKFFTTSVSDEVTKFLLMVEKDAAVIGK
ncbi:MAG: NUDIX domain-containing protein [Candidatus Pacebacteria bacterium]|jgi:ADP-ribose pyrophosphatase YjhB (NUDIX family)|nr:NUDIX domain-containing protein [Candidatus Paceibacterota bacterium]